MDGQLLYQTSNDLRKKAAKATRVFIERDGFEVIDTGFDAIAGGIDIVARDDVGMVHFIFVRVCKFCLPDPVKVDLSFRRNVEMRAITWLERNDVTDVMLCFDVADLGIVGENRAILRFHRNVLEAPCSCDELRARGVTHATSMPADDGVADDGDLAVEPVDAPDAQEDAEE